MSFRSPKSKRLMDIIGAGLGLLLLSPVLALLAVAIKLTSRGPALYRQERMTVAERPFMMLKFRSMRVEHRDSTVATGCASDLTPIGSFLRKSSLDELPQLWNVLKGEMSLVGPRPERSWVVQELRKEVPDYLLKHWMPAGMTGWAQIHGLRGNTCITARIAHDIWYCQHWSLWLDIKILMMTLWSAQAHPRANVRKK